MSISNIKKIAVLTSGGDAPGMNAAIRAVVRAAVYNKLDVIGVNQGYHGLITNDFREMDSSSVSNIIHLGGTILQSARSKEFAAEEGRTEAYKNLKNANVDALVVIGGDDTLRGACKLATEHDFPVVGIPGTIDNDLYGTDSTIGYDTALNTVIEAVDKIRDTATAHNRLFFVEVMGRDAGFIALRSGIASGAEAIIVPEVETDIEKLNYFITHNKKSNKKSSIVLVAEGEKMGGTMSIANKIAEEHPEYDVRVTILGHIQRGGSPSAYDRVLASQLGVEAVNALLKGEKSIMVGLINKELIHIPLKQALKNGKKLSSSLLGITEILSI